VGKEVKQEIVPYLLLQKPKRLKLPFMPFLIPLSKITVGLLPVSLRKQYGLSWTYVDQLLLNTFAAASKKLHTSKLAKLIPDNIRFSSFYRKSLQKRKQVRKVNQVIRM